MESITSNTPIPSSIYLSDTSLAKRFSVSRATIWRWAEGDFPQPVKLSPGCTRWRLAEIEAWEKLRGDNNGEAA